MSRSSVRAVTRIAWRNIQRSRGRSALIVVLMLLPVAAMAGAITLITTVSPTAEETAIHRMGAADYEFQAGSEYTTAALLADLPAGSEIEPWSYDLAPLVLPGRTVNVNAWSMNLDGLARGKLTITAGRPPHNPQEVAISASVAALAGVGIGGSIELQGWGTPVVVGLIEDEFNISERLVLMDASVARAAAAGETTGASPVWLARVPGGGPDYFEVGCVQNECAFSGYGRHYSPASTDDESSGVLVLGGLAMFESILVAAAAFAVSVRRRQRDLGLLAAAGAERRHLAGTVLGEGVLLGGLAAVIGVVVGVLAILAASPWLDDLTNHRAGPIEINVLFLALAGGIGLLACLIAAAIPARSAARLPVLVALSGRRPRQSGSRRILAIGVILNVVGFVLTSTGAAMRLTGADGTLTMLMLLGGAIVGVLGFGAWGPWLIERLERLGLGFGPSVRIALRDTARARSRNSPIVTAILAAFAATVAISAYFASNDAVNARNWQPWARADQIVIQGQGTDKAGPDAAAALGAIAAAPIPWLIGPDGQPVYASIENALTGEGWSVTVGDAELLKALGAEAATADLEAGGIVVLAVDVSRVPKDVLLGVSGDDGEPIFTATLPATVVATDVDFGRLTNALISPATAQRLGLTPGEVPTYVIRLPRPVTEADVATAAGFAAQQENTWADASLGPVRPNELFRFILVLVSLLFALSVTGIAVALGEAEARADQRTLLAIGADPGIRRRIAAARAGVLALMAGVLAVPAGLLPAWGLLGSRDAPLVVPLLEVTAAVVILPLAGIVGALLLTRRIPAWSALRQAGS